MPDHPVHFHTILLIGYPSPTQRLRASGPEPTNGRVAPGHGATLPCHEGGYASHDSLYSYEASMFSAAWAQP
jgi:hypothetical protein